MIDILFIYFFCNFVGIFVLENFKVKVVYVLDLLMFVGVENFECEKDFMKVLVKMLNYNFNSI